MWWPGRRRKVKADLEHARRERRRAEELLQHDQEHIIIPLSDLHKENHIGPLISALIQRKAERES